MKLQRRMNSGLVALLLCGVTAPADAQAPVTLKVEMVKRAPEKKAPAGPADSSNVAVWLEPLDDAGRASVAAVTTRSTPTVLQRNKSFEPHAVVVQLGTTVQFPNKDPFFHNVFSLFNGRRFDLGLYEAGSSKSIRFDRAGVSFLFCNIHPEMTAVIVSVDTPYFALSDAAGRVSIPAVPNGRYRMRVWSERSMPEDLKALERTVTVSDASRALETVRVTDHGNLELAHKNKYGQDYVPPTNPAYKRP